MSDSVHTCFTRSIGQLADEIIASRPRKHMHQYQGCEYVQIGGGHARKLTAQEIDDFRAGVERCMCGVVVGPIRLDVPA